MDWNDLRCFLSIARAGTLAGAGRQLGVEHTTVGRRLGALEDALGVRLFTRGPAGLQLTAAGSDILESVQAIAQHAENIERRVAGMDTRIAGTVRLTIPQSVNDYFVQQLSALRRRHPELIIELLSDDRVLDIRRGEAEIAVRFRETHDPDVISRRAGTGGWALYGAPSYLARKGPLLSAVDLRGHDVVGFDASLAESTGAKWLGANARDAAVVMRGNTVGAIASAVAIGVGISPLPCFVAAQDTDLIRLAPLLIGSSAIQIVVHPDLARVARIRVTTQFLAALLARDAVLWSGAAPQAAT